MQAKEKCKINLKKVFVYGTLKAGEPNHEVISDVENGVSMYVGKAKTCQRWPLVIASVYNIPYLMYIEGTGKHVVGEVYEVDEYMLAALDELETHPSYYERIEHDVTLEAEPDTPERTVKCWIYFLVKYKDIMLNLDFLDDYSSKGPHGLEYVPRYLRLEEADAAAFWREIQGD